MITILAKSKDVVGDTDGEMEIFEGLAILEIRPMRMLQQAIRRRHRRHAAISTVWHVDSITTPQ